MGDNESNNRTEILKTDLDKNTTKMIENNDPEDHVPISLISAAANSDCDNPCAKFSLLRVQIQGMRFLSAKLWHKTMTKNLIMYLWVK